MLTVILISILLILIVAYGWHIHQAYHFFINLTIPGPPPRFFLGNLLDVLKTKRLSLTIQQWTKKYGPIYGYYEGHTPILVVSDPDILQEVFIKSFTNFQSRRDFPLDEPQAKKIHLFSAKNLRWKRQRYVMNPTFSSFKLKQMSPLINRTVDSLLEKLNEQYQHHQPFDIYAFLKCFTMDTIWSCGFGIDSDMQNNPNNPYLIQSKRVVAEECCISKLIILCTFMPEFAWLWTKLRKFDRNIRYWLRHYLPMIRKFINDDPTIWIENQAEQLINKRIKQADTNRIDLLKMMLESVTNDDVIEDHPIPAATDINSETSLARELTKHEIIANTFLFMVAGHETTSTALAYIFYNLATYPNEQRKLQEHIDTYFDPRCESDMPSYEVISKMDYLDMFIKETLRLYPITQGIINRQNTEPFYIDKVGTIPAGTIIAADIYSLHFNPDLWGPVDPYTFYPERFATKRHPLAWIPFSAGPRNCIGMKFALIEMKIALVRILKIYSVIDCGEPTRQSINELEEIFVIAPKQVIIRLERRAD